MKFRNLFISNPSILRVRNNQLIVEQDDKIFISIDDISCVIIESSQVLISSSALSSFSKLGVCLFFCDNKHMPCGTVVPMNIHSRQLKILKKQISMPITTKKQIWKDIVKQKIINQAICL